MTRLAQDGSNFLSVCMYRLTKTKSIGSPQSQVLLITQEPLRVDKYTWNGFVIDCAYIMRNHEKYINILRSIFIFQEEKLYLPRNCTQINCNITRRITNSNQYYSLVRVRKWFMIIAAMNNFTPKFFLSRELFRPVRYCMMTTAEQYSIKIFSSCHTITIKNS